MAAEIDRKEHLKAYVLACIRDNVLSWADLTSPAVFNKLLGALSKDAKAVFGELGRRGVAAVGGSALRVLAERLEDFAVPGGKGRR